LPVSGSLFSVRSIFTSPVAQATILKAVAPR
jgi:hypothetical protein